MLRREFITLLGVAAAAWPRASRAQNEIPVVGFLGSETPDQYASRLRMFHRGLSETGFVEGRNVAIEYRWAQGEFDNMPALARDLVRRQVAVIAASSTVAAVAAKAATTAIPIVFSIATDPVARGLVASLARPGGNVTGATNLIVEVAPKRLELLRELNATATNAALLINPTGPNAATLSRDLQVAAKTLGLQLHVVHANSERDFDAVFAALASIRAGGLVIGADPLFNIHSAQLAALALRHRMPTISQYREFATAGGLMSYGSDLADNYRVVGSYTGRILKGEKPADLPVQQSTRVELIINMKTAKSLGLTFPLTLLGRADEVIE
jgi:putative tryptophan/tyrosine transport system substrate-binding protein